MTGMHKTFEFTDRHVLLSTVLRLGLINADFLINVISQILIKKEKKPCSFDYYLCCIFLKGKNLCIGHSWIRTDSLVCPLSRLITGRIVLRPILALYSSILTPPFSGMYFHVLWGTFTS